MSLASASKKRAHPSKVLEGYAGYPIFDLGGREIGTVRELFKSADNGLDYVEVKTGFLKLQSMLIPVDLIAVDEEREVLLLR